MKYTITLILIITINMLNFNVLCQKNDYKSFLCNNQTWAYDSLDEKLNITTYKQYQGGQKSPWPWDVSKGAELKNKKTYFFKNDGSFLWDNHPSCGSERSDSGDGKWEFYNNGTCLKLSFSNYVNPSGKEIKNLIFTYKIVTINKKELKLSRLNYIHVKVK